MYHTCPKQSHQEPPTSRLWQSVVRGAEDLVVDHVPGLFKTVADPTHDGTVVHCRERSYVFEQNNPRCVPDDVIDRRLHNRASAQPIMPPFLSSQSREGLTRKASGDDVCNDVRSRRTFRHRTVQVSMRAIDLEEMPSGRINLEEMVCAEHVEMVQNHTGQVDSGKIVEKVVLSPRRSCSAVNVIAL